MASELTENALRAHATQLIEAGHLPAGTHWAHTTGSCPLFAIKVDAVVLYAGPFLEPYDGCAARLHSPADAFIKGTTPETAHVWISCLCKTTVGSVPEVGSVGQTGVWVGELQRILGNRLNYSIPDRDADPAKGSTGHWGTYTAETRAAVTAFQRDNDLTANGIVDSATWAAIQHAEC